MFVEEALKSAVNYGSIIRRRRRVGSATAAEQQAFSSSAGIRPSRRAGVFPMQTSDFDDYFALRKKGAYREAYAFLRNIMETQPCWSKIGDLYVWCADFELMLNDDLSKAGELLDKAEELGCAHMAPYYSERGYVLWRNGDHENGLRYLEKSVELDPSVTHLAIFGKLLSSDHDKRAPWVWQRVLQQDPENCAAHIYLGMDAAAAGDRAKALLMAKRAEKLNPSADDVSEIGWLYEALDEYELALGAYQKANRLGEEPKGVSYAAIARCYFGLGDENAARKYAEWAMQCNPENEYVKAIWQHCQEGAGQ
jgi:tetratricopeptide (TPR) repeat protein